MGTDIVRPKGTKNSWDWAIITKKAFSTFTIAGGEAAAHVHSIAAGILPNDLHIDKVGVTLESAPGGGKTVTITVTDGTNTMTVNVTGVATSGSTTTNNFDLDVSAETLTIAITTTAGTAAGCCSMVVTYHEVTL